jgi:hypothetical protein
MRVVSRKLLGQTSLLKMEVIVFRRTERRKLDKEKYQCIRQKSGAQNIVKEIKQYQEKWLQHVQRMDANRLPKQAL